MENKSIKYKFSVKSHNKGSDGHIDYAINIEEVSTGNLYTILKRYSDLKVLHDLLRKETSNSSFPKFPPKKIFGSREEEFILKRQQDLNAFFTGLGESAEFCNLPSLLKFVEESKKNATVSEVSKMSKKNDKKDYFFNIKRKHKNGKVLWLGEERGMKDEEKKIFFNKNEKTIKDVKEKFVQIDFQVEIVINQNKEKKYNSLINVQEDLKEKKEGKIEEGKDENFNLIGKVDESSIKMENNIKQKINEINKYFLDLMDVYDTKGVIENF